MPSPHRLITEVGGDVTSHDYAQSPMSYRSNSAHDHDLERAGPSHHRRLLSPISIKSSTKDNSGKDHGATGTVSPGGSVPVRSISFVGDNGNSPSSIAPQPKRKNFGASRRRKFPSRLLYACCRNCGAQQLVEMQGKSTQQGSKSRSDAAGEGIDDDDDEEDDADSALDNEDADDDDADDDSSDADTEDDDQDEKKRLSAPDQAIAKGAEYDAGSVERSPPSDQKGTDELQAQLDAFRLPGTSGDASDRENLQTENKSQIVHRSLPVLTGVIAPFSIMLEIPGLTAKWYVRRTPDGQQDDYRSNPAILDVGLAFSLASAVVANLAILARFTDKYPPRRATIVAILTLLLHDAINAAALIAFGVIRSVDDGFTYSEAYWMTTAATVASLLCTATLVLDYWRTENFRHAGSGLTRKQAQLIVVVMGFLTYISISALIFALAIPLPFLDAMYFMVETLTTIGLGDITPRTVGTRIALMIIAPGGIILLGMVVYFARLTILEELEDAYKRRREKFRWQLHESNTKRREISNMTKSLKHRVKRKLSFTTLDEHGMNADEGQTPATPQSTSVARRIQRRLSQAISLSSIKGENRSSQEASAQSAVYNGPGQSSSPTSGGPQPPSEKTTAQSSTTDSGPSSEGNAEAQSSPILMDQERDQSSSARSDVDEKRSGEQTGESAPPTRNDSFAQALDLYRAMSTSDSPEAAAQMAKIESLLAQQTRDVDQSLDSLAKELSREQKVEFILKLAGSTFLFVFFWTIGGLVFTLIEDWTYFQGFYFVYIAFSSIGFGDYAPVTSAGRAFFIVWALCGFGILTVLFSIISDSWSSSIQERNLARSNLKAQRRHRRRKALRRLRHKMLPRSARTQREQEEDFQAEKARSQIHSDLNSAQARPGPAENDSGWTGRQDSGPSGDDVTHAASGSR